MITRCTTCSKGDSSFGCAANFNIQLHCLVLTRTYRHTAEGAPEFVGVPEPTDEGLQNVLHKIITRMMKLLARRVALVEVEGSPYVADNDGLNLRAAVRCGADDPHALPTA